jgi:mannose-6-phosphate isomerase
LGQYEGRTGINTRKYADALYGRLLKSTKPYLNDEETKDGRILRGTKRLWVQTEWVKAHLSQFEFGNLESAGLAVDTVKHIFDNYLNTDGSWCDRLSEQNTRVNAAIPTSTFYHILCMTAELCRVSGLNENQKTKRRAHVRS